MNDTQNQPGFPLPQATVWLTATAAVCWAVAWYAAVALHGDTPGVRSAVYLAGAAVWGASLVGIAPVALLGQQGVMATVWGYFIGMGIRLALCLGLYLAVVSRGLLPGQPVATTLAVMYVPLLFVEVALVGRYLWAKDFLDTGAAMTAAGSGTNTEGALV